MDSILDSIKTLLGIELDDDSFDVDILMHINSVFMILNQLGAGAEDGLIVTDSTNVWNEFEGDRADVGLIKSYTYLRVRLLFDPPQNASLYTAMEKQIGEYEWRINVQAEADQLRKEYDERRRPDDRLP